MGIQLNDKNSTRRDEDGDSNASVIGISATSDGFYYLTDDARRQVPLYQYRGSDNSLMYKYILSPLAAFCVDKLTPRSIAPNTITLFGLSFMVAAYLIFWYYVPSLEVDYENPPPRWIYLFNCIAILVYQTLDNMDGKQARRTGSSSPLGLLFDHGCDAINSMFGSANWIICMGVIPAQDLVSSWLIVFGPYAIFYVSTWEEYITGELILPLANGPNEGLFGAAMMSLTSFFHGHEFWQTTSGYDLAMQYLGPILPSMAKDLALRNCDLLVIASTIGFIQEMTFKIGPISKKYGVKTLPILIPMTILCVAFLLVGMIQPDIWLRVPRTSLALSMFLFVESNTDIMFRHITAQPFVSLRWQYLPLVVLTAAVLAGVVQAGSFTDDFLLIYTSSLGSYLTFKVVLVINELCSVLNIWCFDIVTPRRKALHPASNGHSKKTS